MGLSVDEKVGREIRHLRWKHGKTQEALAIAVDEPVARIEEFERGTLRVPAQTLWRIAGEFRVEVKVFFPLEEDGEPGDIDEIAALVDLLLNREEFRRNGPKGRPRRRS